MKNMYCGNYPFTSTYNYDTCLIIRLLDKTSLTCVYALVILFIVQARPRYTWPKGSWGILGPMVQGEEALLAKRGVWET